MLMPILESNVEKRRAAILRVASKDVELGFLMAMFNFEWFLRRMILVFSKCPTVVIRAQLVECHGFWDYCDFWNLCVCKFDGRISSMTEILGVPPKSHTKENAITQYCGRRHVLVHGARGGIGFGVALCGISCLLKAVEALNDFAQKQDKCLFSRLNSRQNVCCGFAPRRGIEPFRDGQTEGSCQANLMKKCPMISDDKTRGRIFKYLRKTVPPINELDGLNRDAFIEKLRKVAEELGLANEPSIIKAIRELEKKFEANKVRKN